MSLLILESKEERMQLAQAIFDRQLDQDSRLGREYDDYRRRMMLQDINYNLEHLATAVKHQAPNILIDYTRWLLQLLAWRMVDLGPERVREQMDHHFQIMQEVLEEQGFAPGRELAREYLEQALEIIRITSLTPSEGKGFAAGPLGNYRARYLDSLIKADKKRAQEIIEEALANGVSLEDIYMEIFQKVLVRVGELWHRDQMTVAQEHYATALTQNIMGQLYPRIFARPRINRSVVACCIGSELHEMSVRMVVDFLEMGGWDSIYLGAGVPPASLLQSIREHEPDLVVLSVTMPVYLDLCRQAVEEIKELQDIEPPRVAVGGRALNLAPHLPAEWGADVSTNNARELLDWTREKFNAD